MTSKYRGMLQDAKENIKLSQNKQKEQYDRKHNTGQLKFSVGTLVLKKDFLKKKRKGGCMDPKWLGPYKIIKDLGKGFFSLQCIETEDVVKSVHGAHLKIYLNPPEVEVIDLHASFNVIIFLQTRSNIKHSIIHFL